MIEYIPNRGCIFIKTFEYNFNYKPAIYDYIMSNISLNEEKREKEILELIRKGKTCDQIGMETGYSSRTIARRRKDLHNKITDLIRV